MGGLDQVHRKTDAGKPRDVLSKSGSASIGTEAI